MSYDRPFSSRCRILVDREKKRIMMQSASAELINWSKFYSRNLSLDMVLYWLNLYISAFKSQSKCEWPELLSLQMRTRVPEWDSVYRFVHKTIHLFWHERPVWPMKLETLKMYLNSILKNKLERAINFRMSGNNEALKLCDRWYWEVVAWNSFQKPPTMKMASRESEMKTIWSKVGYRTRMIVKSLSNTFRTGASSSSLTPKLPNTHLVSNNLHIHHCLYKPSSTKSLS